MAYYNRAIIKQSQDDQQGALDDYSAALKISPDFLHCYLNRGALLGEMKQYKPAIADLTKAIELKPGYPIAFIYRGVYEYSIGQKPQACDDFNKAKQLGYKKADDYITKYCNGGGKASATSAL